MEIRKTGEISFNQHEIEFAEIDFSSFSEKPGSNGKIDRPEEVSRIAGIINTYNDLTEGEHFNDIKNWLYGVFGNNEQAYKEAGLDNFIGNGATASQSVSSEAQQTSKEEIQTQLMKYPIDVLNSLEEILTMINKVDNAIEDRTDAAMVCASTMELCAGSGRLISLSLLDDGPGLLDEMSRQRYNLISKYSQAYRLAEAEFNKIKPNIQQVRAYRREMYQDARQIFKNYGLNIDYVTLEDIAAVKTKKKN